MAKPRSRVPVAFLLLVACLLLSGLAAAYAGSIPSSPDGTPGYITSSVLGEGSANDGFPADDASCSGCHGSSGTGPSAIAINGTTLGTGATPTTFTVLHGTKTTFTLSWTAGSGKSAGGFLLMHNDTSSNNSNGALGKVSTDTTVHACTGAASGSGNTECYATLNGNTEVMHEKPKAASGGTVSFDFTYLANASNVCQTFEFGVWVNSVNGDSQCYNGLDFPDFRRFRITTNCDDGNSCTTDTCNGTSCINANNALSCNDGDPCTVSDQCSGGACSGSPKLCTASDQCHNAGSCGLFGICSDPAKPNGSGCNADSNACTQNDSCEGGTCTAGTSVVCPLPDQCHDAGACNPATGICSNPAKANGTSCDDGNSCTSGETCQAGACIGGVGMTCTALDQCHVAGTCSGGVCSNPLKPDGTGCNADGNACTQNDSCQAGTCVAGTAVVCPAPDQCHTAGTCNTSTGVCSNPQKSNGTPCNDGKACTTSDACTGGVCGGSPTPCDDGIACTMDGCSEIAGGCTHDSSKCGCANDTDCDDGNPCNGKETCNRSTLFCSAGMPIDCSAFSDGCNVGTCAPSTGKCSAVPKSNGTSCSDSDACTTGDTCQSGSCKGTPITCTALDQCHVAGTCTNGTCSNPSKADGSVCNDQNACTTGETCSAGVCNGGASVTCNDGNPCTVDGCSPASGCTATPGNAGAACAPPSCSGGVGVAAAACTGSSAQCPAGATKACTPYACGSAACLAACARDSDCAPGNYCAAGGHCVAKGTPGVACSSNNQCTTSFCADGVCCNDDCVGQCEACNLPGKPGTCSPVTGKPVTPRSACAGNGTGCDGACDGMLTTACVMPGQSKQCRTPSCDAKTGKATLAEFCDGSGVCAAVRTQDCAPGVCGQFQCTGCSTNVDCGAEHFCRGGVCKPLSEVSTSCSIDAECSSGHCVDSVCCDSDCTGQCEACNQPNMAGHCLPIPMGMPPAQGRPGCAGAGTPCGGVCDGTTTRACTYPGPGVTCRDADCKNGVATLIAFCDGSGSCPQPSQESCPKGTACVGVLCGGASSSCTSDTDCNAGANCAGGVCVVKKSAGATCNTANECSSGSCVDGFCCTQACGGQCEACNEPGSEGICIPITGAPRGSRQACASDGSVCGGSCDGVRADACSYEGPTTACRPGKCLNGLADLAAFCQSNGSCAPLQQQSCDVFACDGAGMRCNGPCKVDGDCAAGQYCSAGVCVVKLANGATCGSPSHCTTGNCVDGVCCDGACTGDCEACDQVEHIGACSPVVGAPRAGRPSCLGSGACGGYCDGASGSSCAMPGASTSCGVAFCASGVLTKAPVCNGAATCVLPGATSCDPYQCDPGGIACLTSCSADGDCAFGLVCLNGGCAQPVPDAGVGPGVADAGATGGNGGVGVVDAAIGVGGRSGTGGKSMAGGDGGKGTGGLANGGSPAGTGVSAPDAGLSTSPDSGTGRSSGPKGSRDAGGCGCRVGQRTSDFPARVAVLAIGMLVLVGRRRRREPVQQRRGT